MNNCITLHSKCRRKRKTPNDMKNFLLTLLMLVLVGAVHAQVETDWDKKMKETRGSVFDDYEKFRQNAIDEYESFRQKANAEYAKFLEEAWKPFQSSPAEEIPWAPKPEVPFPDEEPDEGPAPAEADAQLPESDAEPEKVESLITLEDAQTVKKTVFKTRGLSEQIIFDELESLNEDVVSPEPMEPILGKSMAAAAQNLYLYGSMFPIRFEFEAKRPLKLRSISEKHVAKLWTQLSDPYYDDVIAECLTQRKQRGLCDWAYIKLTQNVAEKYCGEGTNESVVMQLYLLTQSGYKMRIARADNRLTLLFCSAEKIFRYKYFTLEDGLRFYILDRTLENASMNISNHPYPGEKPLTMSMTQPKLNVQRTTTRTITSKRYPEVSITLETNQNLIDYYNECPLSSQWNYYSKASLSKVVKDALYPPLESAIEGKTEWEAVDIILNLVQTGFPYATDQEQFGYERPLYPDETLYYPYCDCEDRAILFSCLVRELVGLDVVLLNYPGHLATAVRFNDEVEGDFIEVEGQKYIICEPTFVRGASVGRCAKEFKTAKPKVVKI